MRGEQSGKILKKVLKERAKVEVVDILDYKTKL